MYKRNKRSPQLFLEEEKIMNFVEEYEIRKLKLTAIEQCIAANASDFLCSNTSRKVKRPSNQFIIFSTIYGKLLKDIVNEISARIGIPNDAKKLLTQKLCSIVWNEMNKQEKSCFNTLAKLIKDQHTQRFPDYSFNPNKARNRNTCRFVPYNHISTNNKNNSGNNNSGVNTSIEIELSEISQTQKSSQTSFESQTSLECDRGIEHIESSSLSSSSSSSISKSSSSTLTSSSSTTSTPILSSSTSTSSSTPILEFSASAVNSTSMVYSSLESMKLPLLFFSPVGLNFPTPSLLSSLPPEFNEFEDNEDNDYHL